MNLFAESAETSIRDDGKKKQLAGSWDGILLGSPHCTTNYTIHTHCIPWSSTDAPSFARMASWHGRRPNLLCPLFRPWNSEPKQGIPVEPQIHHLQSGDFIVFFSYLNCCSVVQPYLEWLVETTHMLGRVKTTSQVFSEEKPCLEIAYSRWYERSIGKKHLWWRYPCREVQWAVATTIRSLARFGIAICG